MTVRSNFFVAFSFKLIFHPFATITASDDSTIYNDVKFYHNANVINSMTIVMAGLVRHRVLKQVQDDKKQVQDDKLTPECKFVLQFGRNIVLFKI